MSTGDCPSRPQAQLPRKHPLQQPPKQPVQLPPEQPLQLPPEQPLTLAYLLCCGATRLYVDDLPTATELPGSPQRQIQ
jgi:hypothetical protein